MKKIILMVFLTFISASFCKVDSDVVEANFEKLKIEVGNLANKLNEYDKSIDSLMETFSNKHEEHDNKIRLLDEISDTVDHFNEFLPEFMQFKYSHPDDHNLDQMINHLITPIREFLHYIELFFIRRGNDENFHSFLDNNYPEELKKYKDIKKYLKAFDKDFLHPIDRNLQLTE